MNGWELTIALLFAASLGGLTYAVFNAFRAGAEAYADAYAADTARQFEDLFLFIPPDRIRQASWGASAALFILFFALTANWETMGGLLRGAVCGGAIASAGFYAPRLLLRVLRAQRLRKFEAQLEDALTTMSNSLKSGFSISQAFEAVVREGRNPIAQEFGVMLHQTRVGVRFEDALVNLDKRVGSEDLTLMIRSIEIARLTGGNLTEVFDKIAETIRERLRIQGRIRTLTAQGKLQGIVIGLMPIILAGALMVIDPKMMRSFLASSTGVMILVLVGIFELAGGLMIRKIIRIDV